MYTYYTSAETWANEPNLRNVEYQDARRASPIGPSLDGTNDVVGYTTRHVPRLRHIFGLKAVENVIPTDRPREQRPCTLHLPKVTENDVNPTM